MRKALLRPLAAALAWAFCAILLPLILGAAFQALFGAWNVNAGTVARAPGWAQWLYAWHGSCVTLVAGASLVLLCAAVFHVPVGRPALRDLRVGHLGLVIAVMLAALFTLTDSLRAAGAPRFSPALIPLGAILLLSVLGEELLTKGVLYASIRERWGRLWAAAAATLAFFLIGGGLGGTVISGINVALLGLLCCLLYERYGLWTTVLFRWGWSFATVLMLGQGGGAHAVLRLYGVSENLLTGGDAGFACGLMWTTILLALIAISLYKDKQKG